MKELLILQRNELTEHYIYKKLASKIKDSHNKEILNRLSKEELGHYERLKEITKTEVQINRLKYFFYLIVIKIFGFTFGLKLMEKGEKLAQKRYENILNLSPQVKDIVFDEKEHEEEILSILDEERLKYVGSMVLGLSDALVELTGVLAGLTFSLRNTQLIALSGLITGISASLSMAGSEYLSTKSEGKEKNPTFAAIITGITYVLAVFCLILPYFLFKHYAISFLFSIIFAVLLVFIFTFYISIAQDLEFRKRFFEMIFIIFLVSTITFLIGNLVKTFLGVKVD
ncbi:MAG: rubrerythrin family protein [Dictyoglomus sp. NZ13-RE01]|nr:MAG: rubrerythrin family protein [Dictyoglomus sp. NZ13-RE01]